MLKGKNILLGITGSIAAYKAAFLIRLLVKEGASVKVVMTPDAKAFIAPLTVATLSKNPVISTYTSDENSGGWNNHVELALWADLIVLAPLTANTLAKLATGICDNVLMATYLSAKCDVLVAPSMDLDMYQHATTQQNIATIKTHGVEVVPAENGELASGLHGEGRMAEPENIMKAIKRKLSSLSSPLANKKILITAGPTHEAIDPVRFIGNHSSGKMGFALAEKAAALGADVTLIAGPTTLSAIAGIKRIDVVSASEMLNAVEQNISHCDALIMSAAVADYTPVHVASQKIKKATDAKHIELKPTKDILGTIKPLKKANQVFIGFALETENELVHAQDKLERKGLDFIVLNSMNDVGAGFGYDTNKITIIDSENKITRFELKKKSEVAEDILKHLAHAFN